MPKPSWALGRQNQVTPVVFRGQGLRADIAEPMQDRFDTQLRSELSQSLVLRAAADNSKF